MTAFDLPKRLLNLYAVFVSAGVLVLICSGGLVTSHGAGLAVPDWPNSFGYNMFLFPISQWVGGVFFEHTHRLIGAGVGMLTLFLCLFALIVEDRSWVKTLTVVAVAAVIIQGILGGTRVTERNALLGLIHGCFAQLFFCLMAGIALVTSRTWRRLAGAAPTRRNRTLRFWTLVVTAMLFVQLILGASMRHAHAGLAITDFPTVYGGWLPPVDPDSVARINEARAATLTQTPTSGSQILLQYVHRIWALIILVTLVGVAVATVRHRSQPTFVRNLALSWAALILIQFSLGAWTIWSNKAADIATAHVFFGALTLMTGVLLSATLSRTIEVVSGPVGRLAQPPSAPGPGALQEKGAIQA
jgi:cytochrome c oxidase assembly protein subunit 15